MSDIETNAVSVERVHEYSLLRQEVRYRRKHTMTSDVLICNLMIDRAISVYTHQSSLRPICELIREKPTLCGQLHFFTKYFNDLNSKLLMGALLSRSVELPIWKCHFNVTGVR